MNVGELIEELKKHPQWMDVCVWDHDEDDNMPVVQVMQEDGSSHVQLLTHTEPTILVHPFGSCGNPEGCGACGDQP